MKRWYECVFSKSPPGFGGWGGNAPLRSRFMRVTLGVLAAALMWHASAVAGDSTGVPAPGSDVGALDPGVTAGVPFDADAQQQKLDGIARGGGGAEGLASRLRDPDPVIASAALHAISSLNSRRAIDELLEVINDTTEPLRLQALQLLLIAPGVDNAITMPALRSALNDPDPALVECATQALAIRGDPEAVRALTDALREGSVATRLSIVRSVGNDEAARQYLYYALRDSDESVRRIAEEALSSKSDVTADR
jgi:hypothetical protein